MPLSHARAYVRWEQLALFPLDELALEITVHFDRRQDTLQVGIAALEGSNGQVFSLHVSGTKLSSHNVSEASRIINTVMAECLERLGAT